MHFLVLLNSIFFNHVCFNLEKDHFSFKCHINPGHYERLIIEITALVIFTNFHVHIHLQSGDICMIIIFN